MSKLNAGNRGRKFTSEHRKKLSEAHKGKIRSKEHSKHLSEAKKGSTRDMTGVKLQIGEDNPFYGKHHSEETKKILSDKAKVWWRNPKNRAKILNDKMLKRRLKGLFKRPTKLETKFDLFLKENKLPYKYVGDGSFILGFKNPDFINTNGKKICIEVRPKQMCKIWNGISAKTYKQRQEKHYSKYGWECIVVWEEDIGPKIKEVL